MESSLPRANRFGAPRSFRSRRWAPPGTWGGSLAAGGEAAGRHGQDPQPAAQGGASERIVLIRPSGPVAARAGLLHPSRYILPKLNRSVRKLLSGKDFRRSAY